MSASLRDQRIRIYAFLETGVNGMPGTSYVWQRTAWGRKSPASAREIALAAQSQHEVDWTFVFADTVTVSPNGVLKHGGTIYKVTGIYRSRRTGELVVHTIEASDEVYDNVSEPVDGFVTAGRVNDWDMTDQTNGYVRDLVGGVNLVFGSVPPAWEVNPPMIKFPVGAQNDNTYARTALNALTHSEEYTVMQVVRVDASLFGGIPTFWSEYNVDGDATTPYTDRVSSGGNDATAFQVSPVTSPGASGQVVLDEAPTWPRMFTHAMTRKDGRVRYYVDGKLVSDITAPRGYIRQGIKALSTFVLGRAGTTNGIGMRDAAEGKTIRYNRALADEEIAQNHNAYRALYPALTPIIVSTGWVPSAPPIGAPFLFIRADHMSKLDTKPDVGPNYKLGISADDDLYEPLFDLSVTPPVILFGNDDGVYWTPPLPNGPNPFDAIIRGAAGFSLIVAADHVASDQTTSNEVFCSLGPAPNPTTGTLVDYAFAFKTTLGIPQFGAHHQNNTAPFYRPADAAVVGLGKRIHGWSFDPAQPHATRVKYYRDGVATAVTAFGSDPGSSPMNDGSLANFVWGQNMTTSIGLQKPVGRQFAMALYPGILSDADQATVAQFLRNLGWV